MMAAKRPIMTCMQNALVDCCLISMFSNSDLNRIGSLLSKRSREVRPKTGVRAFKDQYLWTSKCVRSTC